MDRPIVRPSTRRVNSFGILRRTSSLTDLRDSVEPTRSQRSCFSTAAHVALCASTACAAVTAITGLTFALLVLGIGVAQEANDLLHGVIACEMTWNAVTKVAQDATQTCALLTAFTGVMWATVISMAGLRELIQVFMRN